MPSDYSNIWLVTNRGVLNWVEPYWLLAVLIRTKILMIDNEDMPKVPKLISNKYKNFNSYKFSFKILKKWFKGLINFWVIKKL